MLLLVVRTILIVVVRFVLMVRPVIIVAVSNAARTGIKHRVKVNGNEQGIDNSS